MDISEIATYYAGHLTLRTGCVIGRFLSEDYFPGGLHASAAAYLFPPFLERINRHLYLYWVTWRKRVTFIMT